MSQNTTGREKIRNWTKTYHSHGKRRGKMQRAWDAFMRLVRPPSHRIEPMQDPKDFFKGRR